VHHHQTCASACCYSGHALVGSNQGSKSTTATVWSPPPLAVLRGPTSTRLIRCIAEKPFYRAVVVCADVRNLRLVRRAGFDCHLKLATLSGLFNERIFFQQDQFLVAQSEGPFTCRHGKHSIAAAAICNSQPADQLKPGRASKLFRTHRLRICSCKRSASAPCRASAGTGEQVRLICCCCWRQACSQPRIWPLLQWVSQPCFANYY
jgi:hypothetical protein